MFHLLLLGSLALRKYLATFGGDSGNVQKHGRLTGLHKKPTGCRVSGPYAPGPEEDCKIKYNVITVRHVKF
jgi:hypothetical protein